MPRPDSLAVAILLTGLTAFGAVSTDLYLPSLPDMTRAFGTSVSLAQLTLSVFVGGFAVAQLVYGPLSDRYGRRPVLLGGLITYFFASLFCLFATSIETLIAGRFLQALGACAGPVLGRAVVRDVYPRETAAKVLSYIASAMALAPAVGPIAGGWLHELFGWRANFMLMATFGAVLLAASWFMLAETNRHPDRDALKMRRILGSYLHLLGQRQFLGYVATLAFNFAGLFSFLSLASFVLIDVLGLAPRHFGFAFAAVVVGYMTGTFLAGRLGGRVGVTRMIGIGSMLGALSGLVLAGLAWNGIVNVAAVVVPMSVYFLSVGLVLPNSTAAALAPFPRMAGSASSLLGFLQMTTGAIAGFLVGRLHDGTTLPMAAVIAATGIMGLLAYLLLVRRAKV